MMIQPSWNSASLTVLLNRFGKNCYTICLTKNEKSPSH